MQLKEVTGYAIITLNYFKSITSSCLVHNIMKWLKVMKFEDIAKLWILTEGIFNSCTQILFWNHFSRNVQNLKAIYMNPFNILLFLVFLKTKAQQNYFIVNTGFINAVTKRFQKTSNGMYYYLFITDSVDCGLCITGCSTLSLKSLSCWF